MEADKHGWQHWRLTQEEGVYTLYFDRADTRVNTLNAEVILELDQVLSQLPLETAAALVIRSGKSTGFIAGADIHLFQTIEDEAQARELMQTAHKVLNRLAALPMPTIAMIDGFCLGGGFELALACRYRIAIDQPKTKIGLPEVKLGILPGWGGSVRLPRLIGVQRAMALILPGRVVSARAAKKWGMVNEAVPPRDAERALAYYIQTKPKEPTVSWLDKTMATSVARRLVGKKLYAELKKKKVIRDHYPAPYTIVDNWVAHGAKGQAAFDQEIDSIAHLIVSPTARHLVDVFFMSEQLKTAAKGVDFHVQHVHVIGAGTMGGDIAAWCALRGLRVTLQDREPSFIAPAIKRAHALFKKKLKRPALIAQAMDRLIPDIPGNGIGAADVLIEAIVENTEAKQTLFQALEQQAKPTALLATNTSSIPLAHIGKALKNPSRLVGVHFFNPVAKMPLVEVVHAPETQSVVRAQAQAFVLQLGKMPLPVASRPGFLVNRVLMPYLMEAMLMMEEGVPKETIDRAAVAFGMPMGPVRLADQVGLDICLSVAENLASELGLPVPDRLRDMVEAGEHGVKRDKGFYRYAQGRVVKDKKSTPGTGMLEAKVKPDLSIPVITDRLILSMLNESVACLRDNVVQSSDDLDIGMILGTGFAPFRAGPMHYARERGVDTIVATLEGLAQSVGERFEPDPGWHEWVASEHRSVDVSQGEAEDASTETLGDTGTTSSAH